MTAPEAAAIIPARGGSKGVPGKNLRPVGGVPLLARAIRAAQAVPRIGPVWVSTDAADIAALAQAEGARVIDRPAELAGDQASSESALLHALDVVERDAGADAALPRALAFLQCTSPFIDPADLAAGVDRVLDGEADSVFAAVESHDFLWRDVDAGSTPGRGVVTGVNHDPAHRPRRQDRRPDFRETGAFYVMATAGFRAARHRFFGRIGVVPVAPDTAIDVDLITDLQLAEALAGTRPDLTAGPAAAGTPGPIGVDAVVTDFDGVHTPDTAYVDAEGRELVRVSRSDGMGVERLRAAGVPLLILSKERNAVVRARAAKLGVEVLHAVDDKAAALTGWLAERGLDPARVAYVGNDVNDLAPMALVGWPLAVPDAHPEVLAAARVVLTASAGAGAVREVCERVLAGR
ncbi:N-acylneuraminate cytidylyltransferase [Friedmanniella endophytica]|uniref:N-acylneuraminate cytidylyltransferase n=1 Tax=Microlunatus kandeliicorticis TaxID=1759536 RepID=A0A7W3IUL0_9ACTN|nr:acylneuraminate cytidylyltransferase [Microlunatus kandeliicorticis]MBA8795517.1 N-acylneuraminate cytidylyltransferase [Microlunatus kandeliicorticis]